MRAVIYMALCVPNNKLYFGITAGVGGFRRRKSNHLAGLSAPKTRFQRALRKHGAPAFVWYELGSVSSWDDACVIERFLISYFDTRNPAKGYNDTAGGDGVPGRRMTPKMTQCQKGRVFSEQLLQNLREARQRRAPHSEETRLKMSRAMQGRKMNFSPEALAKISTANKGKSRKGLGEGKPHAAYPRSKGYSRPEEVRRKISETMKMKMKEKRNALV